MVEDSENCATLRAKKRFNTKDDPMRAIQSYDYVIVGAGSAGCVLANRLSEDPAVRVCLIEAGKKDNSLLVRMPAGVGNLIKDENPYNWGFWTTPQKHMDDRKLWWPRGRGST